MIETLVTLGFVAGAILIPFGVGHILDKDVNESLKRQEEERRKAREEEEKRRSTSPTFTDGVTRDEFEAIVNDVVRRMPRINSLIIEGLVIRIEVESNSGLSNWSATIDFNDYGHLTGWYEVRTDNDQSPIPGTIAKRVKERIEACKAGLGND